MKEIKFPRWMARYSSPFFALGLGILAAVIIHTTINQNLYLTLLIGSITTVIVLLAQILSIINRAISLNQPLAPSAQERWNSQELALFLYLDTAAVDDLFNQIAPRLRLSEIRRERGRKDKYGLGIPGVPGVSYSGAENQQETRSYRPDETPQMKLSSILGILENRRLL